MEPATCAFFYANAIWKHPRKLHTALPPEQNIRTQTRPTYRKSLACVPSYRYRSSRVFYDSSSSCSASQAATFLARRASTLSIPYRKYGKLHTFRENLHMGKNYMAILFPENIHARQILCKSPTCSWGSDAIFWIYGIVILRGRIPKALSTPIRKFISKYAHNNATDRSSSLFLARCLVIDP